MKQILSPSKIALLFCVLFVWSVSFLYYPKWKATGTEATLSWDVSGYYMYLPAIFIYKDLKGCSFQEEVLRNYEPTPDFQQAFVHESGNHVMKYSVGQAIMYLPFFGLAHAYASLHPGYEADGFSLPYQFAIAMESLLMAFLGLFVLRKVLLRYFSETATAWTLAGIVIGSNYLDYSAINGAMTHNFLFTIYALILYFSIRFHEQPTFKHATFLGLLIGLAALTRPTEILAVIIPLLWNIRFNKTSFADRFKMVRVQFPQFFLMGCVILLIGSIQLFYWRYASGDWIVYSYEDQGFSWIKTHVWKGLFSHKSGWLMYSPLMIFSLLGFIPLFKNKDLSHTGLVTLIFSMGFIYIAFSWDVWWYGASLGQRTMVQAYPILAFPLAAFFQSTALKSRIKLLTIPVLILFVYLNLWFTHQAHKGGLLHCGGMTSAYYWKVIGTYKKNLNDKKLLDTNEEFTGIRRSVSTVLAAPDAFELNDTVQFSPAFTITSDQLPTDFDWIRVNVECFFPDKEWNIWRMTRMHVTFMNQDKEVKKKFIRIQRLVSQNQNTPIFLDVARTDKPFDRIEILFWNSDGTKSIRCSNILVESYNE